MFIPLVFAPGEAYQFDWSYETVELGGQVQPVKVAHLRLAHSRVFLAVAYLREAQEMVFDAHWRAFQLWGGIPRRGIYDNLKTAVDLIFGIPPVSRTHPMMPNWRLEVCDGNQGTTEVYGASLQHSRS